MEATHFRADPAAMRVAAMLSGRVDIDPFAFAGLVKHSLREKSGKVFYSGNGAFSAPSPLYVLGLNPGGCPVVHSRDTISRHLVEWTLGRSRWSAYADESWEGAPPGTYGMAPRVLHLFDQIGRDPRSVPASNLVFLRTTNEAALAQKRQLLAECWQVHDAVIRVLGVSTVLCFGGTAGRWVRSRLKADELVDRFVEQNSRNWINEAHCNADGVCVITLTHPSHADWRNPKTDPSSLVRRMLAR